MEENNRLYVGSLPFEIDNDKLGEMFGAVEGVKVTDAMVIIDKFNDNKSKGFGFVTVETPEMAELAIKALNDTEINGRKIKVNIARPREERPRDGGHGDRGNFYSGNR